MQKHKLLTFHSRPDQEDHLWMAAFDEGEWKYESAADYFFQETGSNGDQNIGEGLTKDEAIVSLCLKHGVKLWNEE